MLRFGKRLPGATKFTCSGVPVTCAARIAAAATSPATAAMTEVVMAKTAMLRCRSVLNFQKLNNAAARNGRMFARYESESAATLNAVKAVKGTPTKLNVRQVGSWSRLTNHTRAKMSTLA